jgi:hypothetical protein
MLKKYFPLKMLDQMEPDLAGSFYVRSSIKLHKRLLSYYQKRTILPYVLFLVTAAMLVGRMETNEEAL